MTCVAEPIGREVEVVPSRGRRAWLALVLVTGLMAACVGTAPDPSTPSAPVATAADAGAPRPVAGLDWTYSLDGDLAKLAYGAPNSDDLRLGLECEADAGTVLLSREAPDAKTTAFRLESGGETETVKAASEPSPMSGGRFLTGSLAADHPVFARFRQTGWLAQWDGAERQVMVPQPASEASIDAFFAHCG